MSGLDASELECSLCCSLLFRPVTTPCGHSFCLKCLSESLRHKGKCPMCRSILHASPSSLTVSVQLDRVLRASFPELTAKRKAEEEQEEREAASKRKEEIHGSADVETSSNSSELGFDNGDTSVVPCFVLCSILPLQRLQLHIFEARYRIMTRRCLEGSRKFGLLTNGAEFGTEMEIVECEELPGGRFYLEVVGRRIFRICESWMQDNYLVSRVEFVDVNQGEPEQAEILALSEEVGRLCNIWQELAARGGLQRNSEHMLRFYRDLGTIPPATEPGSRAMWIAALLNPPRPLPQQARDIREEMLSADSILERLTIVHQTLQSSIQGLNPSLSRVVGRQFLHNARVIVHFSLKYAWLVAMGWYAHKFLQGNLPSSSSSGPPDASPPNHGNN